MFPSHQLRTDFPDHQPIGLRGKTINSMADAINRSRQVMSQSFAPGAIGGNVGQPPFRLGVAEIVNDDFKASRFYLVAFRYFDGELDRWQKIEQELPMDAAAYRKFGLATAIGGPVPDFNKGDCVPAYFDAQALICVPIQPPPSPPSTNHICSFEQVLIPRGEQGSLIAHNNCATIVLEKLDDTGDWKTLLPDLVLRPTFRFDGVTGSVPVIVKLRSHDQLRLRCGTHHHTRARMFVTISGMSIKWLGRISSSDAFASELSLPGGNSGKFSDIHMQHHFAGSNGKYADEPDINTSEQTNVSVRMSGDTSAQWLAEITIWAGVVQTNSMAYAIVNAPPSESENPNPETQRELSLVEADSSGLLLAQITDGFRGATQFDEQTSIDQRIWLALGDWQGLFEGDGLNSSERPIATIGKLYGTCQYVGTRQGSPLPVYAAVLGEQKFFAKTANNQGIAEKGTVEEFVLYDGNKSETQIRRSARIGFNKHNRKNFAIVERVNGGWWANTLECKAD